MNKEEAIKYLQQLYPNGGHCWLDEQRIEAINMAIKALQEEPVSIDFEQELYKAFGQVKDFTLGMQIAKWFYEMGKNSQEPVSEELETEIEKYFNALYHNWTKEDREKDADVEEMCRQTARHFANWQKEHLWKTADGDELPEIDREVVVFTQDFPNDAGIMAVAIGHRPNPEGWNGKSLSTGKVEHYTPKTYDKGGWNIPNVKYWLDCYLPKEIEL